MDPYSPWSAAISSYTRFPVCPFHLVYHLQSGEFAQILLVSSIEFLERRANEILIAFVFFLIFPDVSHMSDIHPFVVCPLKNVFEEERGEQHVLALFRYLLPKIPPR